MLAVLSNWDNEPIRVRINKEKVTAHLGPCAMTDALGGAVFPGLFTISIPANAFRMFRIDPEPSGK